MKGEVYGISAFPVRESQCQAFHSINEIVGDMVEHLADSFDSNAALLKGCIIKDGTSVMLVSILISHCKSVDSAPLIYEENLNYCYFPPSLLGGGKL